MSKQPRKTQKRAAQKTAKNKATKKTAPTKAPAAPARPARGIRSHAVPPRVPTKAPAKRGPKGGPHLIPVNPDRILKIYQLRNSEFMSFARIARYLSEDYPITAQGVHGLYQRWEKWATKEHRRRWAAQQ